MELFDQEAVFLWLGVLLTILSWTLGIDEVIFCKHQCVIMR